MKSKYIITLLVALAAPHFVIAEEEDQDVKFSDLPAPVAQAIKQAAGSAKLSKVTLGDEDGTPAYETTWQANSHKHEIAVSKSGEILSLEEIITIAETPAPVFTAIGKEAAGNTVLEVEKVLEKGKTHFEAEIKNGDGKVAVSFSTTGEVLGRENPDAEKADKSEKKD